MIKKRVEFREGQYSWVRWILRRITKENQNLLALFQGPTGIGKTYNALSLAEELDPDFPASQIIFHARDFYRILNDKAFNKKKIKVIVFDEPQISMSNRKWQSFINQCLVDTFSTFRHKNMVILFAAPYPDFLDSHARKLLHVIWECKGINEKTNTSKVSGKIQDYNSKKGKTYEHFLQVIKLNDEGKKKLKKNKVWNIPKPSKELIKVYEEMKNAFTSELNRKAQERLNELDEKEKKKDDRKYMTEKQWKVMRALAEGKSQNEVAKEMNVDNKLISFHKLAAQKKGYLIPELKISLQRGEFPKYA